MQFLDSIQTRNYEEKERKQEIRKKTIKEIYFIFNRQQTLRLYDLCLVVLTVQGNDLSLFFLPKHCLALSNFYMLEYSYQYLLIPETDRSNLKSVAIISSLKMYVLIMHSEFK